MSIWDEDDSGFTLPPHLSMAPEICFFMENVKQGKSLSEKRKGKHFSERVKCGFLSKMVLEHLLEAERWTQWEQMELEKQQSISCGDLKKTNTAFVIIYRKVQIYYQVFRATGTQLDESLGYKNRISVKCWKRPQCLLGQLWGTCIDL